MAHINNSNELNSLKMYMKEIQQYPLLSEEQVNKLINDYHNGNMSAKDEIINSNLRLVVSVARKYVSVTDSMEFLDLIQEGNIGLSKCVDKYDSTIATFATFAYRYIDGYIKRSINGDDKMIRRPHYLVEVVSKYNKFIKEYEDKYSSLPSDEEIKENLDISDENLYYLKNKEIYDVDSYNKKIPGEGKEINYDEAVDFLADQNNQYDKLIDSMNDFDLLNVVKDVLTDAEYYVFYYRFFANTTKKKTLQDIANEFNVTRQRIDQRTIKIRQKVKAYVDTEGYAFSKRLDLLKSIYKEDYYKLDVEPVEPVNLCLFKYLKKHLEPLEVKILYIMLLYKVNYNVKSISKIININENVIQKKYDNLIKILNDTLISSEFEQYKTEMLKKYGYSIYNQEILSIDESEEIRKLLK